MQFLDWIKREELSVAATARRLRIGGVNPARTLDRIVRGERAPDADMIARIVGMTDGVVTVQDMHETRLAWLRENRPEKFPDQAGGPGAPGDRP